MLEKSFNKIEIIIKEIQNLNLTNDFEKSLQKYKEGIQLLKNCKKYINMLSLKDNDENKEYIDEINLNITINKIEKDLKLLDSNISVNKIMKVYKKIIACKKKINSETLKINKIIINNDDYNIENFI